VLHQGRILADSLTRNLVTPAETLAQMFDRLTSKAAA
jgi:hypothetical protein